VIADEQPDVIHCEWSNLAPYLNYAGEIPTIITFHNIEADIWKRLGESGTNLIKKIIGKNQATKMAQFEKNWYPKANCCIAVSELDKSVMVKYGARVTVVENGVDLDYYKAVNPKVEDNCISFTASFDTFSNQDGVFFFFDEIYPKLINNCSGLKVVLIGKSPPRKFYDYQNIYKNIFITGTVNDIRKYAAKSQISIVPLRIGGGTRLKILEAMAMKIPVVSTTVGAEGLMVTNGKDIILADNPTEFADNVIKLLNNQNMRYSLIENGLKLVTEKYDWKSLAKKQHQAWSTVKDINKKPKTL
jgi:glycosyltransferase involved in cell wall biosynthesis